MNVSSFVCLKKIISRFRNKNLEDWFTLKDYLYIYI